MQHQLYGKKTHNKIILKKHTIKSYFFQTRMQKYPEKVAKMQPLGWGWVVRRRN